MPKPPVFSSHDLKVRGWTPAMVRDLLGRHDRERPSELRGGSRDRLLGGVVKLYLQDRVALMEASDRFARAQDRARAAQDSASKASETRQSRQAVAIEHYISGYTPVFERPEGWEGLSHHQLWERVAYHSHTYELEFERPGGLSREQNRLISDGLRARTIEAFEALYPELGTES